MPGNADVTPLTELAAKFRVSIAALRGDHGDGKYDLGFSDALEQCADQLDAALAAAGSAHRETARHMAMRVTTAFMLRHGITLSDDAKTDVQESIATALAAASAAARAQGWRTCPATGRAHEWGTWHNTGVTCHECGVKRKAVEPPPRPEQGEGQ